VRHGGGQCYALAVPSGRAFRVTALFLKPGENYVRPHQPAGYKGVFAIVRIEILTHGQRAFKELHGKRDALQPGQHLALDLETPPPVAAGRIARQRCGVAFSAWARPPWVGGPR